MWKAGLYKRRGSYRTYSTLRGSIHTVIYYLIKVFIVQVLVIILASHTINIKSKYLKITVTILRKNLDLY